VDNSADPSAKSYKHEESIGISVGEWHGRVSFYLFISLYEIFVFRDEIKKLDEHHQRKKDIKAGKISKKEVKPQKKKHVAPKPKPEVPPPPKMIPTQMPGKTKRRLANVDILPRKSTKCYEDPSLKPTVCIEDPSLPSSISPDQEAIQPANVEPINQGEKKKKRAPRLQKDLIVDICSLDDSNKKKKRAPRLHKDLIVDVCSLENSIKKL